MQREIVAERALCSPLCARPCRGSPCPSRTAVDQYDSDELPDVKLSPGPSVDFDEIRYDEPVSRQIEVVNVGSVRLTLSLA